MIVYLATKTEFRADILKERGQLARRSLRRRLGLAHSYKVNSSAPSALLGDLPARHSPQDDGGCAFAVQNSSLSLNRRIPNGSWCLFREPSDGSRNGKVVIVQSRDIQDPDTGGQYTVKVYRSEKTETEDSWSHRSIRLEPDSMDFNFKPLNFKPNTVNDLRVVGEFVGIIG